MSGIRFQVLGYRNFNRKADNRPLTVLTAASQCTPADNVAEVMRLCETVSFIIFLMFATSKVIKW